MTYGPGEIFRAPMCGAAFFRSVDDPDLRVRYLPHGTIIVTLDRSIDGHPLFVRVVIPDGSVGYVNTMALLPVPGIERP